MNMLLSLASFAFAVAISTPQSGLEQEAPEWTTITTKIGATVSLPKDMPLYAQVMDPSGHMDKGSWSGPTASEIYQSKDGKRGVALSQSPIEKDEDPKDSDVVKIENVVYKKIDLDDDKVASIRYSVKDGWPTVDMDVVPSPKQKFELGGVSFDVTPDTDIVHVRVSRTKTTNYIFQVYGKLSGEHRQKVLESYELPKEAGKGSLTKWGRRQSCSFWISPASRFGVRSSLRTTRTVLMATKIPKRIHLWPSLGTSA